MVNSYHSLCKEYKNAPVVTHSHAVLLPRLSGNSHCFHKCVSTRISIQCPHLYRNQTKPNFFPSKCPSQSSDRD